MTDYLLLAFFLCLIVHTEWTASMLLLNTETSQLLLYQRLETV